MIVQNRKCVDSSTNDGNHVNTLKLTLFESTIASYSSLSPTGFFSYNNAKVQVQPHRIQAKKRGTSLRDVPSPPPQKSIRQHNSTIANECIAIDNMFEAAKRDAWNAITSLTSVSDELPLVESSCRWFLPILPALCWRIKQPYLLITPSPSFIQTSLWAIRYPTRRWAYRVWAMDRRCLC